jgi:ribosome-binding protein aMBF1 (putative translation factor)
MNQDWETVVIKGANASSKSTSSSHKPGPNYLPGVAALRKLDDPEVSMKRKELVPASRQEMIQRRAALGLTQVQLNQRCSFPANTIRDVESGKLCPSVQQLSVLNRVLASKLILS